MISGNDLNLCRSANYFRFMLLQRLPGFASILDQDTSYKFKVTTFILSRANIFLFNDVFTRKDMSCWCLAFVMITTAFQLQNPCRCDDKYHIRKKSLQLKAFLMITTKEHFSHLNFFLIWSLVFWGFTIRIKFTTL